ncbi:hypothetical protein V6N13_024124 [Hibiscus sabdariffa]
MADGVGAGDQLHRFVNLSLSFKQSLLALVTDKPSDQRKPEDLYGSWMQVVNRRRRNVGNLNMGVNGGASKEQEARGSWFTTLSFESPFGVDMDSGSQRFEEANEVCVASPVVPLDAMDHASALLKHVGNFAEQQRKRQIAQGKLVGTVSGAGKSLAGKDVPAGNPELGVVQVGKVGALDPGFNRSFKLLVRKQKSDIVVVMEPRISGREADKFYP